MAINVVLILSVLATVAAHYRRDGYGGIITKRDSQTCDALKNKCDKDCNLRISQDREKCMSACKSFGISQDIPCVLRCTLDMYKDQECGCDAIDNRCRCVKEGNCKAEADSSDVCLTCQCAIGRYWCIKRCSMDISDDMRQCGEACTDNACTARCYGNFWKCMAGCDDTDSSCRCVKDGKCKDKEDRSDVCYQCKCEAMYKTCNENCNAMYLTEEMKTCASACKDDTCMAGCYGEDWKCYVDCQTREMYCREIITPFCSGNIETCLKSLDRRFPKAICNTLFLSCHKMMKAAVESSIMG